MSMLDRSVIAVVHDRSGIGVESIRPLLTAIVHLAPTISIAAR